MDEQKEVHFIRGKQRASAMDYKGAIDSFEKALEANPRSASAHFELGWLCDQKDADPAAAIYHYQQYLRLRPKAENADTVNTRILACKQDLARTVSLGPVTESLQRQFEQLMEENKSLRAKLDSLQAANSAHPTGPTNVPALVTSRTASSVTAARSSTSLVATGAPGAGGSAQPSTNRTHVVKAGENPGIIARKYGLKVDTLLAANPNLDPRRLQVGQALNIPSSP